MCTLSWVCHAEGYRVFFNRDEQRSRPRALPPHIFSTEACAFVMPTDPAGGGSWCLVNARGITVALLNYYQGRWPKGALLSRGQIVRACAAVDSVEAVAKILGALNLVRFPPFSLAVFTPGAAEVAVFRWDGRTLSRPQTSCPLISSSVMYEQVCAARVATYEDYTRGEVEHREGLIAFHCSHEPSASAFSPCMHREDAHTVSLSVIEVDAQHCHYHYTDGAPCESPWLAPVRLTRI